MSRRQCSVWGCSNRKGRCPEDIHGKRRCSCPNLQTENCPESSELLILHNIVKMRADVYAAAVAQLNKTRVGDSGRKWQPGTEAYVCNSHYEGFQGPTRKNPTVIPTLFKRPPHEFFTPPPKRQRRILDRSPPQEEEQSSGKTRNPDSLFSISTRVLSDSVKVARSVRDLKAHIEILKKEVETLQTQPQRLQVSLLTGEQLHFHTGLQPELFQLLLTWLKPALTELQLQGKHAPQVRILTDSQKLLLVLMRIRGNALQEDLAFRFCIDQSTVSRIFNRWIPLLAHHLRGLIKWPKTIVGPTDQPYNHMPNSVAIIDCTEIFIQRPSNLDTQKSSYSDYKSHTTVKYLVSIDPFTGCFNFVSQGFSGNSSDQFIIENSTFLDGIQPGQRIIADRGFTARDLLAKKQVFLTIPSFLRSSSNLTGKQAMETRAIASIRIRVENAIKRMKDFQILAGTVPNCINKKVLDDIVTVACALCNLQPPLIK